MVEGPATTQRTSARPVHRGHSPGKAQRALIWLVLKRLLGSLMILGALYWAWDFPVVQLPLMLGFLIYLGILFYKPSAWLIVLPAVLPVLDLTFWSGRVFFNEFDMLLAITLGAGLWRRGSGRTKLNRSLVAVVTLLTLYTLFVTWRGALPVEIAGLGAYVDYLSSTNALRETKGFAWALLFLPLLALERAEKNDVPRLFAIGMLLGLAITGLTILWERGLFTGIFDFEHPYRVSGMFFGMHTGGAALDAFLALAIPFVAAGFLLWPRSWMRWLAALIGLLGLYGFYVTYSRANYPVLLVIVLIFIVGLFVVKRDRWPSAGLRPLAMSGAILLFLLVGLGGAILGGTMERRFASLQDDLQLRYDHWSKTVGLMQSKAESAFIGMGRGTYPRAYFWGSHAQDEFLAIASHSYLDGDGVVRMSASDERGSLFLRQRITPDSVVDPALSLRLRALGTDDERVLIEFCERHMLKFREECRWAAVDIPGNETGWEDYRIDLEPEILSRRSLGPIVVPFDIAIMNRGLINGVDITEVQLWASDEEALLENPRFDEGLDNWFVSYGNHQRWHIKNVFLFIYFEGGMLGLLIFGVATVFVGRALIRSMIERDAFAPCLAASLVGALFVGLFDSLFDDPKIMFLFTIEVWLALLLMPKAAKKVSPFARSHRRRSGSHSGQRA